jgi:osmotically-inducible protein OsmY
MGGSAAALRVRGVKDVANELEVRLPADDTPAPDYVKDRIVAAFLRRVMSDMREITITIDGGKVTLTGSVRSSDEAAEAERAAWSASDVTEVDNRIVVAGVTHFR